MQSTCERSEPWAIIHVVGIGEEVGEEQEREEEALEHALQLGVAVLIADHNYGLGDHHHQGQPVVPLPQQVKLNGNGTLSAKTLLLGQITHLTCCH